MKRLVPSQMHYILGAALLVSLALIYLAFVSYRNTIQPQGIIIHHSALPGAAATPLVDADYLDAVHQKRGFGIFYWGSVYHIGYHYVILPDGTVQQGRPERCQGAHASGHNAYLGICLIGNFSTTDNPTGAPDAPRPTPAQLSALVALCHRLCATYQIPLDQVIRHGDVSTTTQCPGDRFPYLEFQNALAASFDECRTSSGEAALVSQ